MNTSFKRKLQDFIPLGDEEEEEEAEADCSMVSDAASASFLSCRPQPHMKTPAHPRRMSLSGLTDRTALLRRWTTASVSWPTCQSWGRGRSMAAAGELHS